MKNKILTGIVTAAMLDSGCSSIKFGKKPDDVLNEAYRQVARTEYDWNQIAQETDDWEQVKQIKTLEKYLIENGKKIEIPSLNSIIYHMKLDKNTSASFTQGRNMLEVSVINPDCKEDKKYCVDSFYDEGANGFNKGDNDFYHTHKIIECEDCNGKQKYATCYHVNDKENTNELNSVDLKYFRELRKINQNIEQTRSKAKSTKLHKVYK